jgi:hypothetical protein
LMADGLWGRRMGGIVGFGDKVTDVEMV